MTTERLIRISELAKTKTSPGLIPAAPATIWRWVKEGKFPAPVKLSARTTVWSLTKVNDWINSKSAN